MGSPPPQIQENMSSVEEVKVEEKVDAAENGAAPADAVDAADKAAVTSESEDEVVVPQEEKSMESKPRARKTILSEMCDHSKPVQKAPNFKEWQKQKESEKFKNEPLELTCETCEKEITTELRYESGVCTRLTCLCFFCTIPCFGQFGGCLCPFFTNFSKIREHKCPKCHAVLHTRAGTWDC